MIHPQTLHRLKRLIWIYFWLLIVEGALRKWFLPQLSTPLLVIRDPVVVLAYWSALQAGIFPRDRFTIGIVVMAFVSVVVGILAVVGVESTLLANSTTANNLFVIAYGLRTNFLHLPLIFLIPKIFSPHDLKAIGKWILILALPMALLIVVQFISPPNAFINRVVGEGSALQLTAGFGKIRPPGTFSFSTGPALFFPWVAAFLFQGLISRGLYSDRLLSCAGVGLGFAVIASASRGLLLNVGLVVVALIALLCLQPHLIGRLQTFFLPAIITASAFLFTPLFAQGIEVFSSRFAAGAGAAGGDFWASTGGRILNSLASPFAARSEEIPLLGFGLGLGTNAASGILTGRGSFLLGSEGEWDRIVTESGPVLGSLYIGLRVLLTLYLGWLAYRALKRGLFLPLLLFGACGFSLFNGQFGPPTQLGMTVFGAGLCLTACQSARKPMLRPSRESKPPQPSPSLRPDPTPHGSEPFVASIPPFLLPPKPPHS